MEKAKRGRPKKENNCNEVCRICQVNLKLTYGNFGTKSCVNLFKPSTRKETFGVVWCESLKNLGISIVDSPSDSQLACNGCYTKIKNLCELFQFIGKVSCKSNTLDQEISSKETSEGAKRKFFAVLSPARSSPPNRKTQRTHSPGKVKSNPSSKKSLLFDSDHQKDGDFFRAVHYNTLSRCNVDDLNTSEGAAVKVVISHPSGEVTVINKIDRESQNIIKNIGLKNWKTAVNTCLRHELLAPEFNEAFACEIARECKNYSKSDSCLKERSPDQLAVFSNKTLCKEVNTHCPVLYSALCQASNLCCLNSEESNERAVNAIALAVSALIRCRNPTMSAAAYRISTVLFHSGVSFKDFTRLNHLGICMSHDRMIALQQKMGENFDSKAIMWRKAIEANKCAKLLVEEIRLKQVPEKEDDDMDVVLDVDVSEATIKDYEWYSAENYLRTMEHLEKSRQRLNEKTITNEVLDETAKRLGNEKLPFFK